MKNKKIMAIVAAVIVVLLLGVILFLNRHKNTENIITRYEWLEMLCEQTGMEQGDLKDPAFEDVEKTDEYYSYVQAAVNWGLLDSGKKFSGDKNASGEFAALTTMKAFGEKKVQIYLNTDQKISDEQYIQLALELGLLSKKELKKSYDVSEDRAREILEKYQELYYGELWPEDYEETHYRENVIELATGDILWGDEDGTELIVTSSICENLSAGDIVVFDRGKEGKIARRVEHIGDDDRLSLSDNVELGEIFESYLMYATETVDFDDIVSYYNLSPEEARTEGYVMTVATESGTTNVAGFKVEIKTEDDKGENKVHIKISRNGVAYELCSRSTKAAENLDIEVNVEDINVKASADLRGISLQESEVHVDTTLDVKGSISMEEEERFELFTIPVKFLGGAVSTDVEIYLVVGVEGNISLQAEFPVSGGMRYEKGNGICYNTTPIHPRNATLEAECTVQFMGVIEPVLRVMSFDIADLEVESGLQLEYKVKQHPQMICTEKSLALPIVTIKVSGDDKKETLVGEQLGLSAEWEVIPADKAPIQKKQHWEEIPGQGKKAVEECTYNEFVSKAQKREKGNLHYGRAHRRGNNENLNSQTNENQNVNINRNPNTDKRLAPLFGKDIPAYFFVQEIIDNGEDYTIRGDVYVRDYIEKESFDALQPGDIVTSLQGETYVVKSIGNLLVNDPVVIELEKDGEKWYCCKTQDYQYYQFPNTLEGNVAYLPLSTEEEFAGYSEYVAAHVEKAVYEVQGLDVPDEILEITEAGPYWAWDDKYTIEDVELTVTKDMPVYDAILGYSYSRKEVEDVIQEYPDMHMYEEGMPFEEAYAENEIQKAQTFSNRFSIIGFYLTEQGDLDLLFSLLFPD